MVFQWSSMVFSLQISATCVICKASSVQHAGATAAAGRPLHYAREPGREMIGKDEIILIKSY